MDGIDRESMMETFLYEMNQLLEQLENDIVQSESGYTSGTINEIFRIMHTVKGSAAMMMYNDLSKAAHALEDLIFYIRENNPANVDYSKVTDLVLETGDYIKEELVKLESQEEPDGNPSGLIGRIESYLNVLKSAKEKPVEKPQPKPGEKKKQPEQKAPSRGREREHEYNAKVYFEEGAEMENVRAYTIVHNLESCAHDISHVPDDLIAEEATYWIRRNGFEVRFKSKLPYEEVHEIFSKSLYVKDIELNSSQPAGGSGNSEFRAVLTFQEGAEMENVRAFGVVYNLQNIVEEISTDPVDLTVEEAAEDIRNRGLEMNFITSKSYDEIYTMLSSTIYLKKLELIDLTDHGEDAEAPEAMQEEDFQEEIPEAVSGTEAETAPAQAKPQPLQESLNHAATYKKATPQHVISVNVQKLDLLLNLVGELVISEAMVTQNPELEGLELSSFHKEARQLHKIINDVQDTVMAMRMVPLSPTFFKMHRIVRDMCKNLGKEVQLEIIGEDTEVDKNIIEHISDPLMHIIRNSVDHGIELPQERLEAGKPEKGTVILEAKNSGGDVLITVRDDGRGLDRDKIMAKARRLNLFTKPEEEYTDKEIYQFVLLPGFSTNEEVTAYSGRGVGMDVVVNNIDMVDGSVLVDSTPGLGSIFTLKIPLTLAIIEGMVIKVGEEKYTIPIMSIINFMKVSNDDMLIDPNGNEMIMARGECYNFVRLNREFELDVGVENIEDGIVMMLENDGQVVCVLIDDLLGEQQVVVKSIPKYIKRIKGIGGCTLLGNGDISLIIDVAGFFDR